MNYFWSSFGVISLGGFFGPSFLSLLIFQALLPYFARKHDYYGFGLGVEATGGAVGCGALPSAMRSIVGRRTQQQKPHIAMVDHIWTFEHSCDSDHS